jgi:alpha-soluble NSF attachment protein
LCSFSNANAAELKIAECCTLSGQFEQAAERYDKVITSILKSNSKLTQYSVREHVLKAILCILCTSDVVGAEKKLASYSDMDATLSATRQYQFCTLLLQTLNNHDEQQFTELMVNYQDFTGYSKTSLLLKIKRDLILDEPLV